MRENGYSVVVDELELGLTAIAAPVRGIGGGVVASLSVSGPSFRLTPDRVAAAIKPLIVAAAEVSAGMSYHPFMGEK